MHKSIVTTSVKFWCIVFLLITSRVFAQANDSLQCLRHTHYYDGVGPKVLVRPEPPLAPERELVVAALPISYDGKLYLTEKQSAIYEWEGHSYKVGGELAASPAVSGDLVVAGNTKGQIVAFSRTKGTSRWKYKIKSALEHPPIIAQGLVFIPSADGMLYALDTNGKMKWNKSIGGALSSPSYDNGIIYIGSGSSKTVALNAVTGKQVWEFTSGGRCPAITDSLVFVQNSNGALIALGKTTGIEQWRFDEDASASAFEPAVSPDYIVYSCRNTVTVLHTLTGKKAWVREFGRPLCGSPMIVGQMIYQPCADFKLHIIEAPTGTETSNIDIGFAPVGTPIYDAGTIIYKSRKMVYRFVGEVKE